MHDHNYAQEFLKTPRGYLRETGFNPITNDIHKVERKFLCVKPHLLFDYLAGHTTYMHSYIIEQKYHLGIKYRKYEYNGLETYVRHSLVSKDGIEKKVDICEISREAYAKIPSENIIRKIRSAYRIDGESLILSVDTFTKNKMLVEVWSSEDNLDAVREYKHPKGILDVTGIKYFSNEYIATNTDNVLTRPLLIIEGTDMIGKSTVVDLLVKQGYVCLDRDQYEFSNHVVNYEEPTICAARIRNSYASVSNCAVFVLYTSNTYILASRLKERVKLNQISRYDMECIEYNTIYKDIVDILETEYSINIKGIDVYEKTPNDIANIIIGGI